MGSRQPALPALRGTLDPDTGIDWNLPFGWSFLFAFSRPVFFDDLPGAAQSEGVRRNRIGDHGTCRKICTVANLDGGHQRRIAAYEDTVADLGLMLLAAVVIAGDGAGADVDVLADDGIAKIGQVIGFCARTHPGLLQLDEIPDVRAWCDVVVHPQPRVRPDLSAGAHAGRTHNSERPHLNAVTQFGIADNRASAYPARFTDLRVAANLREGFNHGVDPNRGRLIHTHSLGLLHGNAGQHQLAHFAFAKRAVGSGQFYPIVDSQKLHRIVRAESFNRVASPHEDLDHVREVVFTGRIVGAQLVNLFPERAGLKTIDAHVGFANGQLFRRRGLLLDDGAHRA